MTGFSLMFKRIDFRFIPLVATRFVHAGIDLGAPQASQTAQVRGLFKLPQHLLFRTALLDALPSVFKPQRQPLYSGPTQDLPSILPSAYLDVCGNDLRDPSQEADYQMAEALLGAQVLTGQLLQGRNPISMEQLTFATLWGAKEEEEPGIPISEFPGVRSLSLVWSASHLYQAGLDNAELDVHFFEACYQSLLAHQSRKKTPGGIDRETFLEAFQEIALKLRLFEVLVLGQTIVYKAVDPEAKS